MLQFISYVLYFNFSSHRHMIKLLVFMAEIVLLRLLYHNRTPQNLEIETSLAKGNN